MTRRSHRRRQRALGCLPDALSVPATNVFLSSEAQRDPGRRGHTEGPRRAPWGPSALLPNAQ